MAAARARVCAVLAQAATFMGDHTIAGVAAATGLALAEQDSDVSDTVRLYGLMGLSGMYRGEFGEAREALHSGEVLARQVGLDRELTLILILTTQIHLFSGGSVDEIRPLAVVCPRCVADVTACLQYAAEKRLPVHARGAGDKDSALLGFRLRRHVGSFQAFRVNGLKSVV